MCTNLFLVCVAIEALHSIHTTYCFFPPFSSRNSGSDFDAGDCGTVPRRMPPTATENNAFSNSEAPSEGLLRGGGRVERASKSHEDILEGGGGRSRLLWSTFGEGIHM